MTPPVTCHRGDHASGVVHKVVCVCVGGGGAASVPQPMWKYHVLSVCCHRA